MGRITPSQIINLALRSAVIEASTCSSGRPLMGDTAAFIEVIFMNTERRNSLQKLRYCRMIRQEARYSLFEVIERQSWIFSIHDSSNFLDYAIVEPAGFSGRLLCRDTTHAISFVKPVSNLCGPELPVSFNTEPAVFLFYCIQCTTESFLYQISTGMPCILAPCQLHKLFDIMSS